MRENLFVMILDVLQANENFEDIESLRMSLENTPIAKCDEINFSIFGLSLANINLIILIFLFLLIFCL